MVELGQPDVSQRKLKQKACLRCCRRHKRTPALLLPLDRPVGSQKVARSGRERHRHSPSLLRLRCFLGTRVERDRSSFFLAE